MTYYGFVLLFAGYQADEARTLRVYKAIVDGWVFFSFAYSLRLAYTRLAGETNPRVEIQI
jgi:hypothetical protein